MTYPDAVRRAGHADGNALFEAILASPSGVVFTRDEYGDDFGRIVHPDGRIALELPEMLGELETLRSGPVRQTTERFPIVLSVGERRSFTANDIFRDPGWRKRDADGALRVSADDAQRIGVADGGRARVVTARGSAEATVEVSETMLAGHASRPRVHGSRRADRRRGRRAELAHVVGLARRVRRHALAQARSRADRAARRRLKRPPAACAGARTADRARRAARCPHGL